MAAWMAALAIAIVPACSSGDQEAETAQAVADWIHPACAPDALQQPLGVTDGCNGPWTFAYSESWTNRTACGEDTTRACETYNTCTSWDQNTPGDFGGIGPTTSWTEAVERSQVCRGTRSGGRCFDPPSPAPATQCTTVAANRRNDLVASLPLGFPSSALASFTVTSSTEIEGEDGPDDTGAVTTRFSCQLSINNFPTQTTGAKPACGCSHFPAKTCERFNGTTVTAPGISRPSGPGAPTFAGDGRTFTSAPVCLTCDEIPLDTDAHAQAKWDCLNGKLASASGPLQQSIAARMKLLLQIAGEHLTATQRATTESLYNTQPQASPACSAPITWDPSCPADTGTSHLMAQSQLCNDLDGNPNTSPGATAAELSHCFGQLAGLGSTPNACRLAMRDSADSTAQSLVKKAQPSFAGDFAAALGTAFGRIGSWWLAARGLAANDQVWFVGQSGVLERWLWSTIEAQRMPLPPPLSNPKTDSEAATLLADIASTRLTNDTAFLNFAFAPGQTASSPPLLTLTADALKSLSDRLERLEPIHDVGCRFLPCKDPTTGALTSTATSQLVRALASLPDATAFTSALAAATDLQAQLPDIYTALTHVRDQHAYLESAWSRYGRPESFADLGSIDNPPLEAQGLAAIVRSASVASASYQDSGAFVPWNRPRLTAGTLRQADLVSFINSAIAIADSDRASYTEDRLKDVTDLLDQSRSGAAAQSQADQLTDLRARALDLANRIDAIDQRESAERTALAGFQAEFEALVNSKVLDDESAYQSDVLPQLRPSAADRHFPNGGTTNVIEDEFAHVALLAGQQLRVKVTRQWAPDCAVLHANIVDPNGFVTLPVTIDQALTGPEGYYAVASGSGYHAVSVSDSSGGQVTTTVQLCNSDPQTGSTTCFNVDHTIDVPESSQAKGVESRWTANFSVGIRLANTPYPIAPAGALLAVITHKGVTGGPGDPPNIDVRVIHGDDVIVGETPPPVSGWNDDGQTEVHFVVNDTTQGPDGSPCAADPSSLQVELTLVTPFGNVAKHLGTAMADTLTAIETQAQSVIDEGELSGAEESALRLRGWSRVQDDLTPDGIGLSGLPSELRQLFDATLERELASIGRRAQRKALLQQLQDLALQTDAITNQQKFTADQDRLLHLVPRWRLRDLSGVKLASSTSGLAQVLTAYAAPIFELRDPASVTVFRSTVHSTAQAVTSGLQINAPYEGSVDDLVGLARAVAGAIGSAQFELPASQRRTIVIAVPRPAGTGHPAWTGPWQTVSQTSANAFWNSAVDADNHPLANATITLTPADIYSGPGGASSLSCLDLAPVVRHVGLYFATDGNPAVLGPLGVEIAGSAAITSPMMFPLDGHATSFESTDPLGIPVRPTALNGSTNNVIDDGSGHPINFGTWPTDLGAGAGISPFTSFRFDMRVFAPPASTSIQNVLAQTRAMFLVFDIERRTSNTNAWVPGVCSLPGLP
jgi:hypothetical protein